MQHQHLNLIEEVCTAQILGKKRRGKKKCIATAPRFVVMLWFKSAGRWVRYCSGVSAGWPAPQCGHIWAPKSKISKNVVGVQHDLWNCACMLTMLVPITLRCYIEFCAAPILRMIMVMSRAFLRMGFICLMLCWMHIIYINVLINAILIFHHVARCIHHFQLHVMWVYTHYPSLPCNITMSR